MSSKTQTTGAVKQFYFNPSTGTYIPIAAATTGTVFKIQCCFVTVSNHRNSCTIKSALTK